jgi:hypothetical protein
VKDLLYIENYKTVMKEITEINGKALEDSIVKMFILPKAICRSSAIANKPSKHFFLQK